MVKHVQKSYTYSSTSVTPMPQNQIPFQPPTYCTIYKLRRIFCPLPYEIVRIEAQLAGHAQRRQQKIYFLGTQHEEIFMYLDVIL